MYSMFYKCMRFERGEVHIYIPVKRILVFFFNFAIKLTVGNDTTYTINKSHHYVLKIVSWYPNFSYA